VILCEKPGKPGVKRYNSYRSYLRLKFGKPVVKIPVHGGFSCPNRDGKLSFSGCSFCDVSSFSPVAENLLPPVSQVDKAIAHRSDHFYLPYLQPFSNTYGSVKALKTAYEPLIAIPGVIGLSIGTRPDCFSSAIYDYLSDLSQRTYLCIELGLQSISDKTLERNNRGHTVSDFLRTADELERRNIETVCHLLFWLPGDEDVRADSVARFINATPTRGVKLHQLMIIRNTALADQYANGGVAPIELNDYSRLVGEFLSNLRPDIQIHRLVANSRIDLGLIAPLWSSDKQRALTVIERELDLNNIHQGNVFQPQMQRP
jgi:radical SAM protein (TIGR01212 family)